MKIGLVGLGRMGRAIQARLAEQRLRGDRLGPRRGAMKAAAEQRHAVAAHPRAVADAADGTVISIITEDNGVRAIFRGKDGFLSGDVQRQAVHRDEHAAADDRARACAGGRGRRRAADRFAGARHHPARARDGKLFAMVGGKAGGHGARPAGAGEARPQDRAHGAERRGLRHEARGQSRARGLHPGDRGVARARHARGPERRADARRARRSADRQRLVRRKEEARSRASPTTSRSISRPCART